jgi:hypothetical protein
MKFRGAFVFHLAALGLIVAAWILPWYHITYDGVAGVSNGYQDFYFKKYIYKPPGGSSSVRCQKVL